MYHPPTKRKQLTRRIVVYSLMTISVVGLVTALVLVTLGYQFDEKDGSISQGGLIQFDTTPDGATVSIDNTKLGTLTPSKKTLLPGKYFVTMQKEGYQTWQKSVDLTAGSVLWLKYARLVPVSHSSANVADFTNVEGSLASPNREVFAIHEATASPAIKLLDIRGDTVRSSTVTIPDADFAAPAAGQAQKFQLVSWDSTSQYLLVKHTIAATTEWIVVDTENVARSKNLTSELDVTMSQPVFSDKNSRRMYAIIGGDLRRIDTENNTISAPLAKNVATFNVGSQSTVAFATKPNADGKRSIGYFTDDASKSKIIQTYNDKLPLYASVGTYFDDSYIAVTHGKRLDILMSEGHLPDSDSNNQLALNVEATRALTTSAQYLSVRTGGRFVIAQHGASFTVYDLELEKMTTTHLGGEGKLTSKLRWIDDYIAWSDLTGSIRLYEFDGANQHTIMKVVPGMDATLSTDGRYLYGIVKTDKTYHLTRVKMIL